MKQYMYSLINGLRRDLLAVSVSVMLIPLSWIYRFGVFCIRTAYALNIFSQTRVSVPVISIGNLTMGGSGKTPMAIFLAKMLLKNGSRPAVIVRGYQPGWFKKSSCVADEQVMMSSDLSDVPVVANPNRARAAAEVIERNQADVLILDDGFQHWKLQRNLDIVLVDCVNPFGNSQMIPAGILREPVSALKRADVIMLTKTDLGNAHEIRKQIELFFPKALIVETIHCPTSVKDIYSQERYDLRRLVTPLVAFCGIGDPASFKSTLLGLGADVKEFVPFMDHHEYSLTDMQKVKNLCRQIGVRTVVTTQKDAVKLARFQEFWDGLTVYSLEIEIRMVKGYEEFSQRIVHVLGR